VDIVHGETVTLFHILKTALAVILALGGSGGFEPEFVETRMAGSFVDFASSTSLQDGFPRTLLSVTYEIQETVRL